MGCCSVTARGTKENSSDGHEEAELLQRDESRKPSAVSTPCGPSSNGGPCCIPQELAPILFWGRTREELNQMILIEPIQGWEGQGIRSYGDVVMSSLAVMQISHTEEMSECFMVLFPLHLLILSMDHRERRFIYQGLLPLSGMRVVCEPSKTGYNFEVSGPMIEPRQVSCLSSREKSLWISALQKHIQEANSHHSPVSPAISVLSYLIPCDQLWQKRELIKHLTSCPIQKWEGKAIHHMGPVIFLSTVHAAHTIDGDFEDRILALFPEDLVFLSVDLHKTSVTHQGTLPLNAIHIEDSLVWDGRLEFLIAGDLMEPILISCITPEDYTQWIFHLQKRRGAATDVWQQLLHLCPVGNI
ncbi:unnamed protein product [Ranitomeya imitator]|uniref:PH domain-containing protein n=1 Tax=Ranitomeya imitator TaxID=111125 RepID=A0ABN9M9D7_9NEOB|nr:unnamed protein product [Ranitomeya imitator]